MMSEAQKYDLYITLQNSAVTGNSNKRHFFSYKIHYTYYNFGSYMIIYEEQNAHKNFGMSCIRISVLKGNKLLDYHNSIEGANKDYLHDMYIAARNKLYHRPYTAPYKIK